MHNQLLCILEENRKLPKNLYMKKLVRVNNMKPTLQAAKPAPVTYPSINVSQMEKMATIIGI